MVSRKWSIVASLFVVASMLLSACGPTPAPGTPVVTEKVVTQIVQGTPMIVTATPPPTADISAITPSKDPTTFVTVTFGDAETLDPALAYETAGGEKIQNMYDTLVFYNREKPTEFVPWLATEVPTVENGGISADGLTYTFKIRTGVKFHDGTDMTPADVAYSFQRGMLQGGTSSPQWLFYEAFFGTDNVPNGDVTDLVNPDGSLADNRDGLKAADAAKLEAACKKVTDAVVVDGGNVVFHLAQPWGPMLATIAQSWGAIQSKAWVKANGGWDGDCKTWQNFYGVSSDEINKTQIGIGENGTGPFKLDHWTPGEEMVLVANEAYWPTTPAWDGAPTGAPKLKKIIFKSVNEFSTRLAMLQAGDADTAAVGSASDWPQFDPLVGEECDATGKCTVVSDKPIRRYKGIPSVSRTDIFLNFAINVEGGNNFVGSGKLDGNGIPPDFFSDVHVRKAFAYCFDWDTYIKDAQMGEGVQSFDVMLPGMIGYEDQGAHYSYDPAKCEEEFKASTLKSADGKSLWDVGFRMTAVYNTGNTARQTVAQILQTDLAAVNPNFVIEVTGIPWPTFLKNQRAKTLPMFISGWLEDIHDPHNWVVPYTIGTYGGRQSMPADMKAQFKAVIDRGVAESDPAKRAEIYKEFNQLFYDNCPTILLSVQTGRRHEQRWVQGWYSNPIYPGVYYYPIWKK